MSRKWIIAKIASDYNLFVLKDAVYGQVSSGQLVALEAAEISNSIDLKFTLKDEIRLVDIESKIETFNKKRFGKATHEAGHLEISFPVSPFIIKKAYEKIKGALDWWLFELSKIQQFQKFENIKLYPYGPYNSENNEGKLKYERHFKSLELVDDEMAMKTTLSKGLFFALLLGTLAGFGLRNKFNIPYFEGIILLGQIGRVYKKSSGFITKKGYLYCAFIFLVTFSLEQIVKFTSYSVMRYPNKGITDYLKNGMSLLGQNYLPALGFAAVCLVLILMGYFKSQKYFEKTGESFSEEYLAHAEISYLRGKISNASGLSIFLIFAPLLANILISHDVAYPSYYPLLFYFLGCLALSFFLHWLASYKFLGRNPLKRNSFESKFEIFEVFLGWVFSASFFGLGVALAINFANVKLSSEFQAVTATFKEELGNYKDSCKSADLEVENSKIIEMSFCDEKIWPKKINDTTKLKFYEGIFGIPFYKKL